jgi:hypothetical protein
MPLAAITIASSRLKPVKVKLFPKKWLSEDDMHPQRANGRGEISS